MPKLRALSLNCISFLIALGLEKTSMFVLALHSVGSALKLQLRNYAGPKFTATAVSKIRGLGVTRVLCLLVFKKMANNTVTSQG